MHYQKKPFQETKLVSCIRGSIYDVIIDLRKNSPTYQKWYGDILSRDNRKLFYIPKGFAHGFKTLERDTELYYMMDQVYQKEYAEEIYPTQNIF